MLPKIIDLINDSDKILDKAGIEAPRRNVERMLQRILNLDRVDLYLNSGREITEEQQAHLQKMIDRRLNNEPLQYILGETEFYGLQFKCDSRGLIPRPETEFVVSTALELIDGSSGLNILDLACGSGNIVIAMACNSTGQEYQASDISPDAIELSIENAELNGVVDKIGFHTGDMFAPFDESSFRFDLILSNPPYIKNGDFDSLHEQIRKFEPMQALFSGADGLDFIRRMLDESGGFLKTGGYLIFELALGQSEMIRDIVSEKADFEFIKAVKDYSGIERVVVLRLCKSSLA